MGSRLGLLLIGYIIYQVIKKERKGFTSPSGRKNVVDVSDISSSFFNSLPSFNMNKVLGNISKITIFLLIAIIVIGGFKIISPGERGVKITLGKVSVAELNEGLHWKIPIIQSIKAMSVKVQKVETVSSSASKDLQVVQTDIALNYNLKPGNIVTMYQEVGNEDVIAATIIQPAIQESVKAATAQFTAEELISKRAAVNETITQGLKDKLDTRGINVVAVNITNFEFSVAFNLAIEEKVKALQEALTEENKLEKIKFQAQQKIETAKGDAESTLLRAKAEAEANGIIASSLTDSLVKYKGIEVWDGVLPNVTSDAGLILQGEF